MSLLTGLTVPKVPVILKPKTTHTFEQLKEAVDLLRLKMSKGGTMSLDDVKLYVSYSRMCREIGYDQAKENAKAKPKRRGGKRKKKLTADAAAKLLAQAQASLGLAPSVGNKKPTIDPLAGI